MAGRAASEDFLRFTPLEWDFHDFPQRDHVTVLHPYPARFTPAIPAQAIRHALEQPGVVLDPFAGCGTTLVEANAAGHAAIGLDVNHLAHFLQAVYTTRLSGDETAAVAAFASDLDRGVTFDSIEEVLKRRTHIPRLQHWFSDGAIQAVDAYLRALEEAKLTPRQQLWPRYALSRVLVRVSRQESDTQYRAVKAPIDATRAFGVIKASLRESILRLAECQTRLSDISVDLRHGDARDPRLFDGMTSPDLVVTSPPYPNSYEYWLYHKYRMFWLDMDPLWSRQREIGARPFYSGTGKLGPEDFRRDMREVLANITRISKPETVQFWVTGDGVVKGERVPTAQIIAEEAEGLGWRVYRHDQRALHRGRSSFQGIGRLTAEDVLMFGR